jgi:hypothetical protein
MPSNQSFWGCTYGGGKFISGVRDANIAGDKKFVITGNGKRLAYTK